MSKSIIFAAPSGSGKTTIVRHILHTFNDISFSISATSRPQRGNEVNGKDYHFFSTNKFKDLIENNQFLEYQEVYQDQFYGTLLKDIEELWKQGKTVIFDVDVVGAINLKKILKDNCRTFYVKAPSYEILEQRLRSRNTETEDKIKIRLEKVKTEMQYEKDFDYVILNDNLEVALKQSEDLVNQFIHSIPSNIS